VLLPSEKVVDDDPEPGLHEQDAAAVAHRIGQARVSVVLRVGEVEVTGAGKSAQPGRGSLLPGEGAGGGGLAPAVHRHRAVGRGSAEEVPPFRLAGVGVGAGVRQEALAERGALDAQQVGVAVPALIGQPSGPTSKII